MSSSKYKTIKLIGKGAFGEAFLVEDKKQKQQFVLKKMWFRDEEEKSDCEREVLILSELNHPNIVTFKESFSESRVIHLVMEYCSGGDMADFLAAQKKYLLEEQIVKWALEILMALQYLHIRKKPILHRDLKPGNIFLTANEQIKIGDFGISRELSNPIDLATTMCGTPLYLSPEVVKRLPYDQKCDVWSLGCCLYELMTFKPAVNTLMMAVLHILCVNPMPTNYSKEFVDFVKDTLSEEPSKRPTTKESVERVSHMNDRFNKQSVSQRLPPSGASSGQKIIPSHFPHHGVPVDSLILYKERLNATPQSTSDDDDEDNKDTLKGTASYDRTIKNSSTSSSDQKIMQNPQRFIDESEYEFVTIERPIEKPIERPIETPRLALERLGYRFNSKGQLRDIQSSEEFCYKMYSTQAENQERYECIAKAVIEYIYERLEKDLGMHRIYLPLDVQEEEPWTFVYVTPNIFTAPDKLMILVHGPGSLRAGIWSRKVVINDSIDAGSQIPWIKQAVEDGYAVLLLNQNQTYLDIGGYKARVRENWDSVQHALYVWDNIIIKNTKVKHIAFVAHSGGGRLVTDIAKSREDEFLRLVYAVAFCNYENIKLSGASKAITEFFKTTNARNWVTSKKPLDTVVSKGFNLPIPLLTSAPKVPGKVSAGEERPEWTPNSSKDSIFQFLNEEYNKIG